MSTLARFLLLPAAFIALLGGCEMLSPDANSEADNENDLAGTTWRLVSFEAADGTMSPAEIGSEHEEYRSNYYILAFSGDASEVRCTMPGSAVRPDGTRCLSAVVYPNEVRGWYEVSSGSTLRIDAMVATEINSFSDQEPRFINALDTASSFERDGSRLRIKYGDDNTLNFEAVADSLLAK